MTVEDTAFPSLFIALPQQRDEDVFQVGIPHPRFRRFQVIRQQGYGFGARGLAIRVTREQPDPDAAWLDLRVLFPQDSEGFNLFRAAQFDHHARHQLDQVIRRAGGEKLSFVHQ